MDGYAYVDIARDGQSNMAIDRELLERAERDTCAIVRLYRWTEPTLSLGHFQKSLDRNQLPASCQLPTVLRASGGGAIVHHHEWTYSIAAPVGDNRIGAATELYDLVHDALVNGLRTLGWDARKWTSEFGLTNAAAEKSSLASTLPDSRSIAQAGCGQAVSNRSDAAFLCFQRRSCGDIVCGDYKVVGSAQRRLGKSVLQHGSILCSSSPHAPELLGLAELPCDEHKFADAKLIPEATHFPKKMLLEKEDFGYLVLSWVTAPLFSYLSVSSINSLK